MNGAAATNAGALLKLLTTTTGKLAIVRGLELPTAMLLLDLAERPGSSLIYCEASPPQPAGLSQATACRLIHLLDAKGLVCLRRLGPGIIKLSLAEPGENLVAELVSLND